MQAVSKKMYTMPPVPGISAALPITANGCQCLSDCKICSSYHSLTGCGISWQATQLCTVDATCDDYAYNRGGKVADQCGSWKDVIRNLFAWTNWFKKSAKNIRHLNTKVRGWAVEYV